MSNKHTIEVSAETLNKLADRVLEASAYAVKILDLPAYGPGIHGIVHFDEWSAFIRQEVRMCFGLSLDFSLVHELGKPMVARVTWASGGGDVSQALAQASIQMDYTQRVACAAMVLEEAWAACRREATQKAVLEILVERRATAWAEYRAAKADAMVG